MSVTLVDFAFSRPAPAAIKRSGYSGVIRYLSSDPAKTIGPLEASSYLAAGLTITLVYEDGASDAEGGAASGTAKAEIAKPELAALGVPPDRPVYFAVDVNLPASQYEVALSCVVAFADGLSRPRACYGPRPFLAYAASAGVEYLYEGAAASWNTGPEPAGVRIHQGPSQVVIDGASVDVDVASCVDYGQWPYEPTARLTLSGTRAAGSAAPPSTSTEEDIVQVHPIAVPTNAEGSGFIETTLAWSTFIAATHEGTRSAAHFAAGEAHAAEVNGRIGISVTGAVRSGTAIVLVATT